MRQVSISEIADLTGRAWRTVKARLEAVGVRSLGNRKTAVMFDSTEALAAVYHVETAVVGELDLEQERARLAAAQREKLEMENAVRRGQLAEMDDCVETWQRHIAAARAKLLAMPTKLAPQLVHVSDPAIVASLIRATVYEALSELATGDDSEVNV